jgi:hypothetical protein
MARGKSAVGLLRSHWSGERPLTEKDWSTIAASLSKPQERDSTAGLIAAGDDETLKQRWWQQRRPATIDELDPAELLIFVEVDDDEVEALLDDGLEQDLAAGLVDVMARAGVSWQSEAITALLDQKERREAASLVLADGDRPALEAWLDACNEPFDAVEVFRALALARATEFTGVAEQWLEALEEAEETRAARYLRAAMATLDPEAYARKLVLGEVELDWLNNSTCVADFLQVHGLTDWIETLALLEEGGAREAFEFAALISVAAAFDPLESVDEEEAVARVLALAEHLEDPYGVAEDFAFQIALGEEDDLIALLAAASLHERARRLQMASQGIVGLPLSGTDLELLPRLEKIELFFGQIGRREDLTAEDIVVIVRCLSDLAAWFVREPDHFRDFAGRVVRRFRRHTCRSISLAAQRLEALLEGKSVSLERLAEAASREKATGLDAVRCLIERGDDEALGRLVQLWLRGPVGRSALYREALMTLSG